MTEFRCPVRQPPQPEPVVVSEPAVDLEHSTKAAKATPVWVRLTYQDDADRVVTGFAKGWTKEHVLVQVPWQFDYYEGRKDVWVEASRVRRRPARLAVR